jgi:hypothetical protein
MEREFQFSFAPQQRTVGFQVSEAVESNSCRYAALQSQQRTIHTQTRSEITLFEGKKSS